MTMNENNKQAEPVAVDHSGLIKRVDAAIERVTQGRGLMSIPADPRSDVDLVLSECKALLQGENPPFWATEFYPAQPVQPAGAQELRYTADRALAECPCCGSLDVGGVHDTVNCYGCGLTVTAPRPLQNAINKWNQRTNKAPAAAVNEQLLEAVRAKILNTPELHQFTEGVTLEALHQRERWGSTHDVGKTPADWFWLVGYLAGKALHAQTAGNIDKALHHTISAAAALANWHAAIAAAEAEKAKGGV